MRRTIVFVLNICCIPIIFSKVFTKCELTRELKSQGFAQDQISDWLCIIEAESSLRTHVIGGPDEDGSFDYGLFQINDRYWCSSGSNPGKGCNIRCKDLLTDDITEASTCAKKIYRQQGFTAWVGWVNQCDGRDLTSLDNCVESMTTKPTKKS